MAKIVGVRFKNSGKVYYFDPKDMIFEKGDCVVVETARGNECGEVAIANRDVDEATLHKPLKAVVRKANEADLKRAAENEAKKQQAMKTCQ
ncbi:MAG: stage 0 sporulation protein, partial [Clostridia bacterium]|nr:stage 0 sporulation protein [Clostridia bacterium]